MNEQPCEHYIEWMSLAQDGMLGSTQAHLLHTHLAICPLCRMQWAAMTDLSRMFHAAPMLSPAPGFAVRFQARLAYREEQRRRTMIWILMGIGVITLSALALPSLVSVLRVTSHLVLPYRVIAYAQGLVTWVGIAFSSLAEAAWVLIRHFATQPAGLACIGSAAAAGTLTVLWMRLLLGRMASKGVN